MNKPSLKPAKTWLLKFLSNSLVVDEYVFCFIVIFYRTFTEYVAVDRLS